jgi:hypothetical protein
MCCTPTWSQSYDIELERQQCKSFYNATGVLETKLISSTFRNGLTFYNAGVVVANSKVVGLAPALALVMECCNCLFNT